MVLHARVAEHLLRTKNQTKEALLAQHFIDANPEDFVHCLEKYVLRAYNRGDVHQKTLPFREAHWIYRLSTYTLLASSCAYTCLTFY